MTPRLTKGETSVRILEVAQGLVQTRGYNGFSYADVASHIGTTTAALHYHYATKADLGVALIEHYSSAFMSALATIELDNTDAQRRLRAYRDLYAEVLDRQRLCLCGMLAAEITTLPEEMRTAVTAFFDANTQWLKSVLETGEADQSVQVPMGAGDAAEAIVGGFQGAMLVAWSHGDPQRFQRCTDHLLQTLVLPAATMPA